MKKSQIEHVTNYIISAIDPETRARVYVSYLETGVGPNTKYIPTELPSEAYKFRTESLALNYIKKYSHRKVPLIDPIVFELSIETSYLV